MKIAVFPGSFDPITTGHVDILIRTAPLFDKVIVAIGNNNQKKYLFDLKQRTEWIQKIFAEYENIEVTSYDGLTVDFCKKHQANFIIRGLRNTTDFNYEKNIAQLNHTMDESVDTVFTFTKPEYGHISSTIVREIIKYKGNIEKLVPTEIIKDIQATY